jgi:DNA-binding transcriptional ArsR family regulator
MVTDVPLGGEIEGQDFRAELFESIGHPMRIKIFQVLNERPMGFAELKRAVGIESSGNMSFHLTKLRHLVMTGADGNYILTDDGKEALWSIGSISAGAKGQEADWKVRRIRKYRLRIALTSLVVGLLLLASVAAFQQQALASQQDQIWSQQQKNWGIRPTTTLHQRPECGSCPGPEEFHRVQSVRLFRNCTVSWILLTNGLYKNKRVQYSGKRPLRQRRQPLGL